MLWDVPEIIVAQPLARIEKDSTQMKDAFLAMMFSFETALLIGQTFGSNRTNSSGGRL